MTVSEPIWNLERRASSGLLFWRRDKSKVKFKCEVEVKEYEKDPDEHNSMHHEGSSIDVSNIAVVCISCVAAVAFTIGLQWFFKI